MHDPVWPQLFGKPISYLYRAMKLDGSNLQDRPHPTMQYRVWKLLLKAAVRAVGKRFSAKTVSTTVVAAVVSSTAMALTLSQEFIGHVFGFAKQ